MPDEIKLEVIDPQPVVAVTKKGPMAEISKLMGDALKDVMSYMKDVNAEPIGPPFARYLSVGEMVEFESGFPVKDPVPGKGDIRAAELPGGEVASVMHRGSYDSLDQTHEMLRHWITGQSKLPNGAPWEVYITDPNQEPDASKWETLIRWPVK